MLSHLNFEIIMNVNNFYLYYSQTGMFRQIFVNEGVPGFYRGLTSLLYREVPGYFCFFYGYAGSVKLLASPEESRDNMCMYV